MLSNKQRKKLRKPSTPQEKLTALVFNQIALSSGSLYSSRPVEANTYNKLNRLIIKAFKEVYPDARIGSYTLYGPEQFEGMTTRRLDPRVAYDHCCDFVVPAEDDELNGVLRAYSQAWNPDEKSSLLSKAIARIYAIGGETFIWR